MITETTIRSILESIEEPNLGMNLMEARIIKDIKIEDNTVTISIVLGYPAQSSIESFKNLIHRSLSEKIAGHFIIDVKSKIQSHIVQKGPQTVPNVKNIIAVASGKGGVGKSTTAVNLALALQYEGARVGLLDADIYGPSQPLILGKKEKPKLTSSNKMVPLVLHQIQSMSMGYLMAEEAGPLVWRGPMVSSALQQLLFETEWDNLDYLIIDLPPGTGDIQLTLAQKIPVTGVVIVTTPQEVALLDAKKALLMFRKLHIPILGVVENMSIHTCRQCGHEEAIFGSRGGAKMAQEFEVPLLGQLPLNSEIGTQTDSGTPALVDPKSAISVLYRKIACKMAGQLSRLERDLRSVFPTIVIETS